jgi:hypothetical protein
MDTTGAYIHARATHIHTRPASNTLINEIAHTTQAATMLLISTPRYYQLVQKLKPHKSSTETGTRIGKWSPHHCEQAHQL